MKKKHTQPPAEQTEPTEILTVPINVKVSESMASAIDAYLRESGVLATSSRELIRQRPAMLRAVLQKFLEKEGFYPPKKSPDA